MLAVLAARWGLLLTRAALALVFGLILVPWPEPTASGFVLAFGLYTLADGAVAAIVAFGMGAEERPASWFVEAVVRVGAGLLALAMPDVLSSALPLSLALWAGLSGLAHIGEAAALRRELTGQWPLPVASALSLTMATWCVWQGADLPTLARAMAVYLLLFFGVLMAFAHRMWQLAREMRKA